MNSRVVISLALGLLFGFGLILSGMVNPAKVLGFLDIFGHWDPSLAFVMGGGIAVGLVGFFFAGKQTKAILGEEMRLPTRRDIDRRLVIGGVLFGAGWGIAGFCPGPALVALGSGAWQAAVFVAAMVAGMVVFGIWEKKA